MNKQQVVKTVISAGVVVAIALATSSLLEGRVGEIAELVRTRQGLTGIGEAAALDVHRSLLAVKNLSFNVGIFVGALGAISISTIFNLFANRKIYIQAADNVSKQSADYFNERQSTSYRDRDSFL